MFFSRRQENGHEGGIGHAEPSRHVLHPEACRHVNFHTKQHHVDPRNRKLVKKTGSLWEVQRNCDFGCLERSFDITQLWCLSVHSIVNTVNLSDCCPSIRMSSIMPLVNHGDETTRLAHNMQGIALFAVPRKDSPRLARRRTACLGRKAIYRRFPNSEIAIFGDHV